MTPIEFAKQMKILTLSYGKEFNEDTITVWYEYFKNINKETLESTIKKIVLKNKYMPSVAELIEEVNKQQEKSRFKILDIMKADNYFKSPEEYVKATKWLETNIIPSWFKNDMMRYYKQSPVLTDGEVKYLN